MIRYRIRRFLIWIADVLLYDAETEAAFRGRRAKHEQARLTLYHYHDEDSRRVYHTRTGQ